MSSVVATEGAVSLWTGDVVVYHVVRATAVTAAAAVMYRTPLRPACFLAFSCAVRRAAVTLELDEVECARIAAEVWWRRALARRGDAKVATPKRAGAALTTVTETTIVRCLKQGEMMVQWPDR